MPKQNLDNSKERIAAEKIISGDSTRGVAQDIAQDSNPERNLESSSSNPTVHRQEHTDAEAHYVLGYN